ncbi:MAG: DNA primase [Planctomycetota bacterium]
MGRVSDNAKQRIRERIDMVALVSEYVSLKPHGPDDLWGCCPFHEEKSPSFHIRPERGHFKCFGCGKGGDVFRFVEEIEGIPFREALERLAARAGVELEAATPEERGRRARLEGLLRASALVAEFYAEVLWSDTPDGARGRAALEQRGVSAETARSFGLGVAPEGWDGLLRWFRGVGQQRGLRIESLFELGLLRESKRGGAPYDFFRKRLMFPIRDEQGRVIAFGARRLDEAEEPKYINSPEIPGFYEKRKVLYGLDRARSARPRPKRLVVVEGYLDVIAPHQAGHSEFVATLGTAFTPDHAGLARRAVEEVVLLFDGDAAGTGASLKALAALVGIEKLSVRVASLPPGMDPDDAVRQDPALLERALDEADDLIGFVIDQTLVGFDRSSVAGQERAVRAALKLLARIPDRIRLFRELNVVAQRFGLPEQVLRDELSQEELGARREGLRRDARGGGSDRADGQGRGWQDRASRGGNAGDRREGWSPRGGGDAARPDFGSGQGRPRDQGRSGQGRSGQGRSGQGRSGQGRPDQGQGRQEHWGQDRQGRSDWNQERGRAQGRGRWGQGREPVPGSAPVEPLSRRGGQREREEYLLEALLGAPAEAARLAQEGYGPEDFSPGPAQRLAGAIFALAAQHVAQQGAPDAAPPDAAPDEFGAAAVMDLLSEEDVRDLCARLLQRVVSGKDYPRELLGMTALRRQRVQGRIQAVGRAIRSAGDRETKSRLLAELNQLRAQLQPGPVAAKAR